MAKKVSKNRKTKKKTEKELRLDNFSAALEELCKEHRVELILEVDSEQIPYSNVLSGGPLHEYHEPQLWLYDPETDKKLGMVMQGV